MGHRLTERVRQSIARYLTGMHSENFGGLVSMLGSCLFLFGGDTTGSLVTLSFVVAEIVLARSGHTRSGYSTGCALFALGDALAVMAEVARENSAFQITLGAMALSWTVGALRAPIAWYGERRDNPVLIRTADALQPIAGAITLLLRIPAIITATSGANYLAAMAVACWAVSDILIGRLQQVIHRSPDL
jgi:hypothetical protein